jgi:hypothetical protein
LDDQSLIDNQEIYKILITIADLCFEKWLIYLRNFSHEIRNKIVEDNTILLFKVFLNCLKFLTKKVNLSSKFSYS